MGIQKTPVGLSADSTQVGKMTEASAKVEVMGIIDGAESAVNMLTGRKSRKGVDSFQGITVKGLEVVDGQ